MADKIEGRPGIRRHDRVGYDLSLTNRLGVMFSAFWNSQVRGKVLFLATVLILVILLTSYGQVILNQWNAPFYDSLERRDLGEFFHQLEIFAMIAGTLLLLNVLQAWLNQMTALYMREGLSRDLVDQWLKRKRALRLASSGLIGVNPDQRLHEDSRNLAESTTGLVLGLLQSTILLVSFIGVLWELSSGFIFHISGHSFSIPGYMVWAAIFYAASASVLSQVVGRKLVKLNADRFSKEAELRFTLMHANENMPAITVARGEENERRRINTDISSVLRVVKRLAMANTNLTWVSAGYGWLVIVIPIIVAAPAYFSGGLTLGQLMMSVGAFNQVNTALRWYVANFGPIAEWRATLMRVTDFRQALLDMEEEFAQKDGIAYENTAPDTLTLKDVVIVAKIGEEIDECGGFRLRETDVVIKAGEKIMINGDHSVNRKLLFQAMAGLWPCGSGTMGLPPIDDMLFVPQIAYVPGGTLREALAFPASPDAYERAAVETALDRAGLHSLIARLDTRARWDKLLDSDEQKAIGFARLLLVRPRWIIFDEVLEGMEPEWQEMMAKLLTSMPESGMIYIGRSEAYLEALKPRVLHLQALPARSEEPQQQQQVAQTGTSASTGAAAMPAPAL
ncbi:MULTISPECIES: ABC transporter ATP-binding protein/permease [unclassified Rhizobium]|uniref:ABC transporter ATP-binding protein/permease n=1 Tax=unclassified Rhizobium TaxID=2613769 RepID=UPI001A97FA87|nr:MULTISPECIES: ABC transporter ATP-binding protein/permease [unclassified Rhizobium]MBX5158244.1 ABC transporter ATP-binding protein/permease [Rhizobium sp. NZLR8]MBX5169321.1 ABC transporter ATP-binding protein/permease [Rhizobium sp. NZLR1b]MBX5182892.1 ABC transporter ATP-binding protein/permease [Rhizobium sp. NZLR5]MBX5189543.1 ABC transporter ATP-binding protein/permease [Rhizobium sp. NZLR3b]MBX5196113.1 ABC transporter ATP-binding protein/permease [Rhizobium sp. NZLR10]